MKEKKYINITYAQILAIALVIIAVFVAIFDNIPAYASTGTRPTSGAYLEYNGNYLPLRQHTFAIYSDNSFFYAGTSNNTFTYKTTTPHALQGSDDSLTGQLSLPTINSAVNIIYASSIDALPQEVRWAYQPLTSCPIYKTVLVVDSSSIVTIGKNYGDRVSLVVSVPHGTNINDVVLDATFTYTLPSNQYVNDLVADLQGKLSNSRYHPIVNSLYKKTWGQSYSTNYRANITLFNEITEHEETIYGDVYYYSLPIDIIELGRNTLNHATLSNINNYPNYIDYLVSSGYISSMKFFVLTPTTQGVIKFTDWNDDNEELVSYQIDKLESDITAGDVSQEQTQAFIDKRNQELNDKLNEYVYNPNIEAGQNIVGKLNEIVTTVTGMIGTVSGVAAMFGLFFTCLPTFVLDILSFTIISLCIISIYKALRG